MEDIINRVIVLTGIKIMWTIALGNIMLEIIIIIINYFTKRIKQNKFNLKYIVSHLSIAYVINRKAKKEDVLCIITAYTGYLCNKALVIPNCNGIIKDFFTGYFNDCIALIMLLAYFNISLAAKEWKRERIRNIREIIFICIVWGIAWENCAQIFNPSAVKDPLDVFCYCIGGIIYWFINIQAERIKARPNCT